MIYSPTERPSLADIVHELTSTHSHREHYRIRRGSTWYGEHHTTRVPSLLRQLEHASPSGQGEDRGSAGYSSRPVARLEALDCLQNIDREASWWVKQLGEDDSRDTRGTVLQLHGLTPALKACDDRRPGCCQRHELEHDVRRWYTQARIVTGWDSPAWRPDNTCPMCSERGGLRVKLADQAAFCVECRETWDESTIGLLAHHIRAESEAERQPRPERAPCACLWPKPIAADLSRLCPWCGSARCWHVIEVRSAAS